VCVCVCVSVCERESASNDTFVQGFLKLPHTNMKLFMHQSHFCQQTCQILVNISGNAERSFMQKKKKVFMQRLLSPKESMTRYVFISQSNNLLGHSRSACFLLYSKNISNRGILSWQQTKYHKTLLV